MSNQLNARTAHARLRQALATLREAECNAVTLFAEILRRARFDALVEKLMKRHHRSKDEIVLMTMETLLVAGEKSTRGAKSTRVDSGAPYQVVVHQCETCKSGTAGPERRTLSAAELERVNCDAMILEPGKRNRSGIEAQGCTIARWPSLPCPGLRLHALFRSTPSEGA